MTKFLRMVFGFLSPFLLVIQALAYIGVPLFFTFVYETFPKKLVLKYTHEYKNIDNTKYIVHHIGLWKTIEVAIGTIKPYEAYISFILIIAISYLIIFRTIAKIMKQTSYFYLFQLAIFLNIALIITTILTNNFYVSLIVIIFIRAMYGLYFASEELDKRRTA